MTGWRLGWLVAPPAAVPDLEKLAQNLYISASSIAQHAALVLQRGIDGDLRTAPRSVPPAPRLPAARVRELGFRIEVEPQGAFYLYADVSAFTDDAQAFCATSWKPSTWRSPRAWISASIAPTSMCGWRIPRKCRGCRRRWRAIGGMRWR
jgi:aspartate/methionine/tyrosine aminotransferase